MFQPFEPLVERVLDLGHELHQHVGVLGLAFGWSRMFRI
jgi:hypothetical protein